MPNKAKKKLRALEDPQQGLAGFAGRFEQLRLRRQLSYQALSDAIAEQLGVQISAQALHKWSEGGNAAPDSVKAVAKYFGVTEAWLVYGVGPETEHSLDELIRMMPNEAAWAILEHLQYHVERNINALGASKFTVFMDRIKTLRSDLAVRRAYPPIGRNNR